MQESGQLLCQTNKLQPSLWCESRLPFDARRLLYEPQGQKELNRFVLTNSAASNTDVELMYSRNLLPLSVPPFGSSLLTVCTQHVHTSGDGFLWRLPAIALCCENETREWEGVEWIWLEGDGWKGCLLLSASFVFDSFMVRVSHFPPFFFIPVSFLFHFPSQFKFDSGKFVSFVFILPFLSLSPLPLFSPVRVEWL